MAPSKSTRPPAQSSAPPSATKTGRWTKARASNESNALRNEASAVRPLPIDDRAARSKNELKAQFTKLSAATSQIGALKRSLNKSFFEVGALLNQIRDERLYEVKGYGSFESFVEREIDLAKTLCLKMARVAETIHREQALAAGLDRSVAAVSALDGEIELAAAQRPAGSPAGGVPLHKQ